MRKALVSILLIGLVGAIPTWAEAGKKKTVTVTKEFSAGPHAPMPMTSSVDPRGCTFGEEGVHKTSVPYKTPGKGVLSVELSGFEGDWDLHVLDGDGNALAVSNQGQPEAAQMEAIQILLGAKQEIQIVACNWAGGPTASGTYIYKYKK